MKLFKSIANWLFSDERKSVLSHLDSKIDELKDLIQHQPKPQTSEHPFKSIRLVGNTIIAILHDGTVLEKENANSEDFKKIITAKTINDFVGLMFPPREVEKQEDAVVKKQEDAVFDEISILRNHEDFTIDEETRKVYFKDISLEIPPVIVASFVEILEKIKSGLYNNKELEEAYTALVMFWLNLANNVVESSRRDILTFIKRNDVRITKYGNMVLYRRIVSKGQEDSSQKYNTIVSTGYISVKKSKKSPKNYVVYQDDNGDYKITKTDSKVANDVKIIGNLYGLYESMKDDDGNDYTAWHNNSMRIRIGDIYRIPENEINLDSGICAAGGLHAAAVDYDYTGFGDIPVVVLVNPSKAITVPLGDQGKLRTTEMFVVCVNNKPHGVHFDDSVISQFDEKYHAYTISDLEEALKQRSFDTISIKDKKPQVTMSDLEKIVEQLKTRVNKI